MPQGTSSGRFLIEIDGVTSAEASEVSGIGIKHEPFKIAIGAQANPILGRSNYECEEVTMKHAYALNSTGNEVFAWFGDYIKGYTTDKLNMRLIQLSEDGFGTAAICGASSIIWIICRSWAQRLCGSIPFKKMMSRLKVTTVTL